jgi:type IV pilus assembly protein PilC
MATFHYRALNPRGRVLCGTLAALNELDLQQQLLQAGITLIEARPVADNPSWLAQLKPIQAHDLIQLCTNLEQLQKAGVKLNDSLRDVADASANPRLQNALLQVQQDVDNGATLSQALAQHPRVFPQIMTALVGAGEATGHLAHAFAELAKHFDWQERLRSRLVRVSAYPLFTVVAMLGVMTLMLGYVIPQTSTFLYSLNITLPASTILLLDISNAVAMWWQPLMAVLILIAAITTLLWYNSTEARYQLSALALRIPFAGNLLRKVVLARFTHTFTLMFSSGLGVVESLDIARRTVTNLVLGESLDVIREQLQSGNPLSLAFRLSGEFPSLVQRMVKIGEESGQLAPALRHVTDYYERDVQDTIQTLIAALGPILTLVAGGLLIWIAVAVFIPVYNALPQLT